MKPRSSLEEESCGAGGEAGPARSPHRRNSGPLAGPAGKKVVKAAELGRVPTPPRKILPKAEVEAGRGVTTSPVAGRTPHLPAGVVGAAGLSNRLAQPMAQLSKPTPTPAAAPTTFTQPLIIQTSLAPSPPTQAKTAAPPAIIVPGGQQVRMPIQMSAVPLQVPFPHPKSYLKSAADYELYRILLRRLGCKTCRLGCDRAAVVTRPGSPSWATPGFSSASPSVLR